MEFRCEEGTWSGLEPLRPVLERYLRRRCRDDAEVEDVIQETYVRASRYRSSLTDERRLRPWAMRIALNVLTDRLHRERPQRWKQSCEEMLDTVPAAAGGEDDDCRFRVGNWLVDKDSALRHLSRALAGLGEEDRRVLASYYGGAQSCRETARVCALPRDLVKVRLFRARKRLLRAMRQRISMDGAVHVLCEGPARIRHQGRDVRDTAIAPGADDGGLA
ncbi:MAG: sigma-70 family RNA polymerase sigma factor [Planctomycetota bacterium]|nr:sigma-70 family RNA polymerase sigma factor [Planctomycetota bacterium]